MRRAAKRCSKCLRIFSRESCESRSKAPIAPFFILDDKARQSVVDDLPDGPAIKRDDRSPAGHRFGHDEAERLGKFVSGIQRQRWLLGACTKARAVATP